VFKKRICKQRIIEKNRMKDFLGYQRNKKELGKKEQNN